MPTAADPGPTPWLSPAAQTVVNRLLDSHQQAYGTPLLVGLADDATALQWAQALFAAATVVLAHDGADPTGDPGPRLIYANRAALQLWRRPWAELVGMPSRLTAEPTERAGRAQALASVQRQRAISNYTGVRIDSRGRRFQIRNARVWSLGPSGGQAAAFRAWHWL
jgi:hypothetical protein